MHTHVSKCKHNKKKKKKLHLEKKSQQKTNVDKVVEKRELGIPLVRM
jgi:hypothetical protein